MKKSVFSVNISDTESKRKVMKSAASLKGIDSLSVDLEKKQLTVVGTVDQVKVVRKLGKKFNPRIMTVGLDKKEGRKDNIPASGSSFFPDYLPRPIVFPTWYHPREEGPSGCVIS